MIYLPKCVVFHSKLLVYRRLNHDQSPVTRCDPGCILRRCESKEKHALRIPQVPSVWSCDFPSVATVPNGINRLNSQPQETYSVVCMSTWTCSLGDIRLDMSWKCLGCHPSSIHPSIHPSMHSFRPLAVLLDVSQLIKKLYPAPWWWSHVDIVVDCHFWIRSSKPQLSLCEWCWKQI